MINVNKTVIQVNRLSGFLKKNPFACPGGAIGVGPSYIFDKHLTGTKNKPFFCLRTLLPHQAYLPS